MAEIKWIKITTNMFDDEKLRLIDAMPERDTIHYIWIRLLVQAGKTNASGYIFLNEQVPYSDEMLSTLFNRPLSSIRLALQTLKSFGMIELDETNLLKITNWEKHQNIEGMERVRTLDRERKRKERERKKNQKALASTTNEIGSNEDGHVMSRDSHAIEQDKEQEEEQDIDKETTTTSSCSSVISNVQVFKHFEKCGFGILSPLIMEKIAADIEIYGSEWVMRAAEVSAEKGKTRYDYIKGILQNWKTNGFDYKKKNTGTESHRANAGAYQAFEFDN